MRIDKIKISNFRGSTNPLEILFNELPITLIFGENGSGKSTIVDAIDFICNKKLGSLENMSVGNKASSYVPSLGTNPEDIEIELHSGNKIWKTRFDGVNINTDPSDPTPQINILRRAEITNLVTAQPSERYKVVQKFVSVPIADYNEEQLKKAYQNKKDELDICLAKRVNSEDILAKQYRAEKGNDGDYLTWAKIETEKDVSKMEEIVKQTDEFLKYYEQLQRCKDAFTNCKNDTESKKKKFEDAQNKLSVISGKIASQSEELLNVLKAADNYIEVNPSTTVCPVCNQSVNAIELKRELLQRISDMNEFVQAIDAKKTAGNALEGSQQELSKYWIIMLEAGKNITEFICDCKLESLKHIKNHIKENKTEFLEMLVSKDSEERINFLYTQITPLIKGLNIQNEDIQKSIHQHNLIKGSFETYMSNENKGKELNNLCNRLQNTLLIHQKVRKANVEDILFSLSDYINNLYNKIHPEENIGDVNLYLNAKKRASLEIGAKFESTDNIPPQAYYSESHIDTLGICIFLALAKYNKADVVILDDVLTSIDSQHLTKFIEMLVSISHDFKQLIVTTHYRYWLNIYKTGRGPLSNIQIVELGYWSLSNGIRTRAFKTEIMLLKKELEKEDFDRQVIASKAGVVLESILDFINLTYHLKIRRNNQFEYTLGELADSFSKDIEKTLRVILNQGTVNENNILITPLVRKATNYNWVRNCIGCHYTKLSDDIPDNEVINFGNAVINLADSILCPICSSLPLRHISGSYWQCVCKDNPLKMYPLEYNFL